MKTEYKKIGILTLHDSINFGAFLQAFALQTKLSELGYESEFILFDKQNSKERLKLIKAKDPSRMYFKYRSLLKFDDAKQKLIFSSINNKNISTYDQIIIGSDEMWNLENPSFAHRPEYFGYNLIANNIISYAPSCNNLSYDGFKEVSKGAWNFDNVNYVSVRDKNTFNLVKQVSNIEATIVVDPTLLLERFDKYIVEKKVKNTLLVYGYGFSKEEQEKIIKFAELKQLKIVSIGLYNKWCSKNICATPFEFLGYLKACDYVVTSTFHGTIFATLMKTKFGVFARNNHKVLDVMKKLKIEDKNISCVECIEKVLDKEINYAEIEKNRKKLASDSEAFLLNALNYNENMRKDNILYLQKNQCCGCSACVNICPKLAISMVKDEEGFNYPHIDENLCIHCGLCKQTCAFQNDLNTNPQSDINDFYGVKHKNDEVRMNSRSGGVFTAISDYILETNGKVYGCVLNEDFSAKHTCANTKEERNKMRKSKYIQSDLENVFKEIKESLSCDEKVLFSGTSCQCAGLLRYLKNVDTTNLLVVDVLCHGVPSERVWKDYLNIIEKNHRDKVVSVEFRNKAKYGWSSHVESIEMSTNKFDGDFFKRIFLSNKILRPACYVCPYKNTSHITDFTIGDFWGIENIKGNFNDNKGVSLFIVNSSKGKNVLEFIKEDLKILKVDMNECIQPALSQATDCPRDRYLFWHGYDKENILEHIDKATKLSTKRKTRITLGKVKKVLTSSLRGK